MNVDYKVLFWTLGHKYTGHEYHLSCREGLRRFKSFYGVTPNICSILWGMITNYGTESCAPKHLLWTLHFLKQYNHEIDNKALFGEDEKTCRKYLWIIIDLLADLDIVKFEERLVDCQPGQRCFTSIDGVDFREVTNHKFKAAALRYEIGICLRTGHIVWKFGGYPAGEFPDLKLARELYVHKVNPGELTLADKGYNDRKYFVTPHATNSVGHKYIMSRHETVNKRIRQFKILYCTFRHDREKHKKCFDSVLNITALTIKLEEPLFSILDA